jgi:hypothetical protein
MMSDRKKKDHRDPGKKRRRMREAVAERQVRARTERPQRDEVDIVHYKPGSGGDRNMRRGPEPPA